jgi:hypothetical protein
MLPDVLERVVQGFVVPGFFHRLKQFKQFIAGAVIVDVLLQ